MCQEGGTFKAVCISLTLICLVGMIGISWGGWRSVAQADQTASSTVTSWSADFYLAGLNRSGALSADAQTCTLHMRSSRPSVITLTRMIDRALPDGQRLQVYASWPRDSSGQIKGVSNYSNDPPRTRLVEQKLGSTVVWVMSGCHSVCVSGVILHSDVSIGAEEGIVYLK